MSEILTFAFCFQWPMPKRCKFGNNFVTSIKGKGCYLFKHTSHPLWKRNFDRRVVQVSPTRTSRCLKEDVAPPAPGPTSSLGAVWLVSQQRRHATGGYALWLYLRWDTARTVARGCPPATSSDQRWSEIPAQPEPRGWNHRSPAEVCAFTSFHAGDQTMSFCQ